MWQNRGTAKPKAATPAAAGLGPGVSLLPTCDQEGFSSRALMAKTDANPPMPEFSTSYVLQEVDPDWLTSAVKPKQFLHIDQAECILCEGCVDICPWKCIHMLAAGAIDEAVNADQPGDDPKDHVFFVVDEDVCTRCALCVDRCPTGVIILAKSPTTGRDGDPNPHQPTRLRLRRPLLRRSERRGRSWRAATAATDTGRKVCRRSARSATRCRAHRRGLDLPARLGLPEGLHRQPP